MKTNPKFIIIFLIISLLLTVFVAAEMQLNASNAVYVSTFQYDNSTAVIDDDFSTCSAPTYPNNVGWAYFDYDTSLFLNTQNFTFFYQTGSTIFNLSLPTSCTATDYIQLKFSLTAYSGYFQMYCFYSGQYWLIGTANTGDYNFCGQYMSFDYSGLATPLPDLTCPTNNCIFHDEFNYTVPVTDYGWVVEPQFLNITPMSDLFYPPQTLELYHDISVAHYYNKNYDTYNLWFIGTAGNADCNGGYYEASGYNEHKLIYLDYIDNQLKTVYDITFYYDTSTHLISGYSLLPDNTLNSFCADCFSPYYQATIEIYSFNNDAITDKFFNVTSGLLQPYLPNTFSVLINSVPVAYNIPMSENLTDGHSNLIKNNYYITSRCIGLDTIDIYGFTTAIIPISNGSRQIGDSCLNQNHISNNALCASGKCSYGKCALLLNNEPCTTDVYCLSGSCNNGFCSNPGQWALINAGTKELFGGNSNDFLFVAIFVLIIIGGGIIIASGGNIWGIVLAGGFFFVGLMFFVVVGWVSPFFLIGGIILALILFVFSFMASQKG